MATASGCARVETPTSTPRGLRAAIGELRETVWHRSELLPDLRRSDGERKSEAYRSAILLGAKAMPLPDFDEFIGRLSRRQREAAKRVLNTWLSEHGFAVVDSSSPNVVRLKSAPEEVSDVAISNGRLLAAVDTLGRDGYSENDQREIARLTDIAREELLDIPKVAR